MSLSELLIQVIRVWFLSKNKHFSPNAYSQVYKCLFVFQTQIFELGSKIRFIRIKNIINVVINYWTLIQIFSVDGVVCYLVTRFRNSKAY